MRPSYGPEYEKADIGVTTPSKRPLGAGDQQEVVLAIGRDDTLEATRAGVKEVVGGDCGDKGSCGVASRACGGETGAGSGHDRSGSSDETKRDPTSGRCGESESRAGSSGVRATGVPAILRRVLGGCIERGVRKTGLLAVPMGFTRSTRASVTSGSGDVGIEEADGVASVGVITSAGVLCGDPIWAVDVSAPR